MNEVAVYRQHVLVPVKEHPQRTIKKPKVWPRLPPDRDVGIEVLSQPVGKELHTVLIALDFLDHNTVLETAGLEHPIIPVLEHLKSICDDEGSLAYMEHDKPSYTRQRKKRDREDTKGRDGRRKLPKPVTLISHNWELVLGRLFRNSPQFRRTVRAGMDGITIHIDDWELEILQLNPGGSGCSFRILARKDSLIMRLFGRSIKGQSRATPSSNVAAFLDRDDLDSLPDIWKNKQWSSFTPDEIEYLKSYVVNGANTAREIYEKIFESDIAISPYVTRQDGSHPPSVAGSATRIVISMLEVEEFERPDTRVQQIGALSAAGGRVFKNVKSGYFDNLYLYDGRSWHGFLMTQLPSPATCEYVDIKPGSFDINRWLGQYGCMLISGIPHSKDNHALRVHDTEHKHLQYLNQPFIRVWATIPEIVMGVVSGRLTVTHIHDGIHIVGGNENSFLRKFALTMEEIRRREVEGSPLYQRAKDLVNVIPGKMLQINTGHPYISLMSRGILIPVDQYRGYKRAKDATMDLLDAHASGIDDLMSVADCMFENSKHQDRSQTFGEYLNTHLSPRATTGAFYLPAHGAQIWGEASARLGLLSTTTNAITGYTDSIITVGDASEGIAKYNALVREAGYEAPETGMGSIHPKIQNGQGYIVTPGQWTIRYADENGYGKQKNALHNLPDLEDKDDETVWNTIRNIAEDRNHSYTTKPRPATLKEAYQLKVEPGTYVSHTQTVSLDKKDTQHDVTRTQRILQEANEYLAHTSSHKIGTPETPLGCIKILSSYGQEYAAIAAMAGMSLDSVKAIATGRKSGTKSLEKLQQVVQQVERDLTVGSSLLNTS